jgi:tetratricopeptide (TPR) repeat protein
MKRTLFLIFLFFALGVLAPAQTQFMDPESSSAQKASAREEELYSDGTEYLNDGNYDGAIGKFDEVARLHGRRADGALYWKAYALNKAGGRQEALTTISQLRKEYPQSKWLRDAGALEIEVKSASGQKVNPDAEPDDLKLYALDSLMQTDPEKALPILEKLLQGNASTKVKDRALFVLSQNRSDKAQQLLLTIAKGSNQPELQKRAIRYLGISGNRNVAVLQDVYKTSNDPEVKTAVLNAYLTAGAKEQVLAAARGETSPELKKKAIHLLGAMGARDEIRQLYKQSNDPETKKTLLQSMVAGGDSQALIDAAKTETDPEARKHAIQMLGVVGGQDALNALLSIYNSQSDVETKKKVVQGLFIHQDAKDLVALARKETNPELKKYIVQQLAVMHSPEATDYMMELLNK